LVGLSLLPYSPRLYFGISFFPVCSFPCLSTHYFRFHSGFWCSVDTAITYWLQYLIVFRSSPGAGYIFFVLFFGALSFWCSPIASSLYVTGVLASKELWSATLSTNLSLVPELGMPGAAPLRFHTSSWLVCN
jgi:hypothetical protein